MFDILMRLPLELQHNIISFITSQKDLLSLSLVSKLYYQLAIQSLYCNIYLNDSCIQTSGLYDLAPSWRWLPLKEQLNEEDIKAEANMKLKLLVRSISNNIGLMNHVIKVRLNWDLSLELQCEFIGLLTQHSQSLRILENITDPRMNKVIENNRYFNHLYSLDIPPPNPLPQLQIPETYLEDLKRFLNKRLADQSVIKNLITFIDPLLLFSNVMIPKNKLEIENLKIHFREDGLPPSIYSRNYNNNWKFQKLKDVFDIRYLRILTIISWFDQAISADFFKFEQWSDFMNLEDLTLIAVTSDDVKIPKLIRSCKCLKRLKLDFAHPQREIMKNSKIYQSLFHHSNNLKFLDIKLSTLNPIINIDLRTFKIYLRVTCTCSNCQEKVLKNIFQNKILPHEDDYEIKDDLEHFQKINFFEQFLASNLSPYSKAVDSYPSVKTGPENLETFLALFNELNSDRAHFKPLNKADFYYLFHCFIHSLKTDLEPFVNLFTQLKFLVLNDIPFIIKQGKEKRHTYPLFYGEGYLPNF